MMKAMILAAAAAATLGVSGVQAQTVQLGRDGPAIDLRSDRQRDRDFRREDRARDYDRDNYGRRGYDRDVTGSVGRCRTVTTRERDDNGRMVSRETRDCR